MTFLSSLGSRSTIARRISCSMRSISARAAPSISRTSASSPSSSISRAPASSSTARRHSSASLAADLELAEVAPGRGRALAIPEDLGVGHLALGVGEARLDLLHEPLDHGSEGSAAARRRARLRRRSAGPATVLAMPLVAAIVAHRLRRARASTIWHRRQGRENTAELDEAVARAREELAEKLEWKRAVLPGAAILALVLLATLARNPSRWALLLVALAALAAGVAGVRRARAAQPRRPTALRPRPPCRPCPRRSPHPASRRRARPAARRPRRRAGRGRARASSAAAASGPAA